MIDKINIDGNVFTDRNLITHKLNESFVNIGPSLAHEEENHPISADQTTIGDFNNRPNLIFHFSETSINQVLTNLKQLEASKATGIDKIPTKILKISTNIIAPSLTAIFNLSLHTGIFISDWKLARVQPIYKSEDRTKCENYR